MNRSEKSLVKVFAGLALTVALVLTAERVILDKKFPTPSLLVEATGSGSGDATCPSDPKKPVSVQTSVNSTGGVSPELTERLAQAFPAGTDEDTLFDALSSQGFKVRPPCPFDQSIHAMVFMRKAIGMFVPSVFSKIYWKVDANNKIIWTKGFVSYTGP